MRTAPINPTKKPMTRIQTLRKLTDTLEGYGSHFKVKYHSDATEQRMAYSLYRVSNQTVVTILNHTSYTAVYKVLIEMLRAVKLAVKLSS